jgi:hypothetical protein
VDVLRQAYDRGLPNGDEAESTRLRLAAALAYHGDVRGVPTAFAVLVELAGAGDPPLDEDEKKEWQRQIDDRREMALDVFDRAPTAAVAEFIASRAVDADDAARQALLEVLDEMNSLPATVRPYVEQWANNQANAGIARHATRLLIRHR